MNESQLGELTSGALARLHAALDELAALDLEGDTDLEILGLWRELEAVPRRLASLDQALIAQLERRDARTLTGASSIAALARQVLRIGLGEARARVAAAHACGPRRALTGEPLEPIYGHVAAAQAAGVLNPGQARVITMTIDHLPDTVQADLGDTLEQMLVERASEWDTDTLAAHARDLAVALDQDGAEEREKRSHRDRAIRIRPRPDGTSTLTGELTAELTEHLRTVLDPLAAPKIEGVEGDAALPVRDPRSQPQRLHDALLDLCKLAERSDDLPRSGGVTTTVILTVDATDLLAGCGTAVTGHGVSVPLAEALSWIDGESRLITVALNTLRRVEAYGSTHRIFTENQRLALIARDRGCVFPGCAAEPAHCETHHVREYHDRGPTDIDNGVLLCRYHHRHFEALGWRLHIPDGIPWWTPPPWIDPDQKPLQNHMHHRQLVRS